MSLESTTSSSSISKARELARSKIIKTQAIPPIPNSGGSRKRRQSHGDVPTIATTKIQGSVPKMIIQRRATVPAGGLADQKVRITPVPIKEETTKAVRGPILIEAQPMPGRIKRTPSTTTMKRENEANNLGWSHKSHHRHSWQSERDRGMLMFQLGIKKTDYYDDE